jgi:hypothetical protein
VALVRTWRGFLVALLAVAAVVAVPHGFAFAAPGATSSTTVRHGSGANGSKASPLGGISCTLTRLSTCEKGASASGGTGSSSTPSGKSSGKPSSDSSGNSSTPCTPTQIRTGTCQTASGTGGGNGTGSKSGGGGLCGFLSFFHPLNLLNLLATILADGMQTLIVDPLMAVATALLSSTVFNPESLTGTGVVASAASEFWKVSALVSVGVALFGLAWGSFTRALSQVSAKPRDMTEVLEAAVLYVAVFLAGYPFLTMFLDLANHVTTTMVAAASALNGGSNHITLAFAALVAGVLGVLLYPTSMLVIAALLLWAGVSWVMRMVDLIFYVGLLPVTAALTFTGNKNAFQWNFNEAVGAVLTQMAMAVAWYVAWLVLSTPGGSPIVRLFVGIGAIALVTRAPGMLQQIIGHRTAGVLGLAMGVAAGSLLSREARSAVRMSPMGAALSEMGRQRQERAKTTAMRWAQGSSVGERLARSRLGQSVSRGLRQTASGFASVASGAAERAGGVWQDLKSSAMAADPAVFGAMTAAEIGARAVGAGAKAVGSVAYAGAKPMIQAARTAASLAYQPRLTLGRGLETSVALGYAARHEYEDHAHTAGAVAHGLDPTAEEGIHRPIAAQATAAHVSPQRVETAVRDSGERTMTPKAREAMAEELGPPLKPDASPRELEDYDAKAKALMVKYNPIVERLRKQRKWTPQAPRRLD